MRAEVLVRRMAAVVARGATCVVNLGVRLFLDLVLRNRRRCATAAARSQCERDVQRQDDAFHGLVLLQFVAGPVTFLAEWENAKIANAIAADSWPDDLCQFLLVRMRGAPNLNGTAP
jgi:hypothetical protein